MTATARRTDAAPDWLVEARQRQAAQFSEHGLPTTRLENWKYTSLRPLEGREFAEPDSAGADALQPEDLGEFAIPGEGWRIALVDGIIRHDLSALEGLSTGVTVTSLSQAGDELLTTYRDALSQAFADPDEALASLAAGTAADALIIDVAPDTQLERPLHLLMLAGGGETPVVGSARILMRIASGASITVIEQHRSLGDADGLANQLAQINLEPGARCRLLRLQQHADSQYLVSRTDVEQAADSRFEYLGLDLGGRLVRHDINCRLQAAGAHASLNGVYALDGRRHVDNHSRIDHIAPSTTSEEFFKGVMDGRSRAVFNGKVVVHEGADGTDAAQTNNNLLLSRHAEVDTKPELVIYADDVKCSHGATVGQLDGRQLFYLRSRGIPETEARLLLTYAFCREVVEKLEQGELLEHLVAQVVEHLPRHEALAEFEA